MKEKDIEYLKKTYGENIKINHCEDKNLTFDIFINYQNINVTIEYKHRYFDNEKYQNDILIELIQNVPDIQKINLEKIKENNLYQINTSIGWFYKCKADRLIFFRYLDNNPYDVIDIDWKFFSGWFLNNIDKFETQYSPLTTHTINAIVKIEDIPKICKKYYKYEQRK
jgi:hypothetical protein